MYVEEICLSATVDDSGVDQPPEEQHKVAVLEQINRTRRCRSVFTLFNNHRLAVETHGFMQNDRNYTIDIGILDPHPKRSIKIGWNYLLIFVSLCTALWLIAFNGITLNLTLPMIVLSVCAGLSLVLTIYRSHDRFVFYSQHGRVPLVVLFHRLPDRAALDSFTANLVGHIKEAKDHNTDINEILIGELKEHRRLMEEGVISNKRYDIVKKCILGQHR